MIWFSDCDRGVDYPSDCAAGPGPGKCRLGKDNFIRRDVRLRSNSSVSVRYTVDDPTIVLSDCLDLCWRNCTCVAFESLKLDGAGCALWTQEAQFEKSPFFGDQLDSTYKKLISESGPQGKKLIINLSLFNLFFSCDSFALKQ